MSDTSVFSLNPWVKGAPFVDLGNLGEDYRCAQTALT